MKKQIRQRVTYLAFAVTLATPFFAALRAQRLPTRVDPGAKVILRGSKNPRVERLVSEGPVDGARRISGITLRFRPTDRQSAELERLLQDQQDPSSPLYHAWLTPEEYGERFGLSVEEYLKVADWVVSRGFQIDAAARSRTYLSFSGTAAQVRETFDTELHRFRVGGVERYANAREAAIPAELEPIVCALEGLDDFVEEAHVGRTKPHINGSDGSHALTPGDLAVIYNVVPLYQAGINGAGQKIVVTGQSALNLQDVRQFREAAMLPPSEPKVLLTPGSQEPGFTNSASEALLDVQYAGGAAPGATIIYVYGTNASRAAEYAVDQNLAPVISHSFGRCEKRESAWIWFRNVAQQAAVQGITWVAASGDSGPAACDYHQTESAGVSGFSVNLPASVPEVTAVGGTTFVDGNGNYWAKTAAEDGTSALSYIPEKAWNDSAPGKLLAASGGGLSIAYPRPSWQNGPGISNVNARHVPDVAFTASWEHIPYLMIVTGDVVETGGTSAGAPFFAGVLALLNQYVVNTGAQSRPGLGNINPRLYQLAQSTRGVFHDITAGNIMVPCEVGTPDCVTGQYGYHTGPGYDLATGLGSIDVTRLLENWIAGATPSKAAAVVVPSIEPVPVYQQAPDADGFAWFYTLRVSETAGTPATITSFAIDGFDMSDYIVEWFGAANLPAKGSLSIDLRSKDLQVPSDHTFAFAGVDASGQKWAEQVTASFRGFASPNPKSASMSLISDPAVVVKVGKGDPNCSPDRPFGQQLILRELNGSAVRLTRFLAGGNDYSDRIASWFGSPTLPASGSLQARLCWQLTSVPVTLAYQVDGIDGAGNAVQAILLVEFKSLLDQKSGGAGSGPVTLANWPGASRERRSSADRRRPPVSKPRAGALVVAPRQPPPSAAGGRQ